MNIQNTPVLHNYLSRMNMGGGLVFTSITGRRMRRYTERKLKKLQKKGVSDFTYARVIDFY
jgi:hypothetical protein